MSEWQRYLEAAKQPARNAKSYPATWKPENEGDEISGLPVSVEEVETQYGLGTVATLDTGDEMLAVWLSRTLLNAFEQQNIETGDVVSIVFNGKRRNQADTFTYKDYSVGVVKALTTAADTPF